MVLKHQVVPPGSYDKADERDLFWNGTVAMNIDGPWFVGMTREYDPALMDDLGVIASPDIIYNGEPHKFHGEIYAITNLISSNCAYPDEAWKLMEWMASDEAQAIVSVSGMIPSSANYYGSDAYWEQEPLNAQLAQLAEERYLMPAELDPNIPQMGEMTRVMVNAAQEAFINGADVKETLDKAAEEIKVILSQ
jgi:ABC-type glycerol-3-phosphate transport system substrate-binding protein